MKSRKYKDVKEIFDQLNNTTYYYGRDENEFQELSRKNAMDFLELYYLVNNNLITDWYNYYIKDSVIVRLELVLKDVVIDTDLRFLSECSNEEIRYLTDWLIFDQVIDNQGKKEIRAREELSNNELFKDFYPGRLHLALPLIENELLSFGSHILSSKVTYKSVLFKVCDELKVNYNPLITVQRLECELLKKVWDLPLKKLTLEDINQISIEKTRGINKTTDGIFSSASYRVIIPCVLIIAFYRLMYSFKDEVYQKYLAE